MRGLIALFVHYLILFGLFNFLADVVWLELRREHIAGISPDCYSPPILDAILMALEAQKARIPMLEYPSCQVGKAILPSGTELMGERSR